MDEKEDIGEDLRPIQAQGAPYKKQSRLVMINGQFFKGIAELIKVTRRK